MTVVVNGAPREIADGSTITALLESLGWRSRWVVVERNGEPVERARFGDVALSDGDRLEIVRPVAGGAARSAPATGPGDARRERLTRARLYLCTGGHGGGRALDELLDAVLGAGVDVVQLREKEMEAGPLLALAERFREACDRHDALFVVNDRADVALAAGADGVHLGQDDLPPHIAREMAGPDLLIGRSTHARAEIERAAAEPVDYIAVGPVYETPTKPGRPAVGLDLVRFAAAAATGIPWFAIGGIDSSNVGDVATTGATRIVVVRAITEAADPGAAAAALRAALTKVGPEI